MHDFYRWLISIICSPVVREWNGASCADGAAYVDPARPVQLDYG